jgi:hypothetical protein
MNRFVHARILRALFVCFQNAGRSQCGCDVMELPRETTLIKVRLHWGIFLPVIFAALAMVLYVLVQIVLVRHLVNIFGQLLGPINRSPEFQQVEFLWLIPLILGLVVVVAPLLMTWLSYKRSEISLTNWRLLFRTGFLWRRSGECPLENVESIYITESLLGRLCGYGTVTFTTVGGAGFPLSYIGSPQQFHSILQEAVLNAKNSFRGLTKPTTTSPPRQDDDSHYMPKG